MSVGLGRSQLDSKGGVVGGTVDVNALEMVGTLKFPFLESHFGELFPVGVSVKRDYYLF